MLSKKKKKGLHKNFSGDLQKKKKKKKSSQKFFKRSSLKNVFRKFFKRSTKFYHSKKSCCPRAEDRPIFEDLRPRGQGQGLDLRGQGQGLQNVSSRPRTSSKTPPLLMSIVKDFMLSSENLREFWSSFKAKSNMLLIPK